MIKTLNLHKFIMDRVSDNFLESLYKSDLNVLIQNDNEIRAEVILLNLLMDEIEKTPIQFIEEIYVKISD